MSGVAAFQKCRSWLIFPLQLTLGVRAVEERGAGPIDLGPAEADIDSKLNDRMPSLSNEEMPTGTPIASNHLSSAR